MTEVTIPTDNSPVELVFSESPDGERPVIPAFFDEDDSDCQARTGYQLEQSEEMEEALCNAWQNELTERQKDAIRQVWKDELGSDEKWLDRETEDDDYTQTNHWSSKHVNCPRQRYYKRQGLEETEPMTLMQQKTFTLGSAIGNLLAEAFIRAGLYIDHERYFNIQHPSLEQARSGKADVIIQDFDGSIRPVENKSTSSGGYYTRQYGRGKGRVYHRAEHFPRKGHVLQLYDYIVADVGLDDVTEDDYGYIPVMVKEAKQQGSDNTYVTPAELHNYLTVHKVHFNWELYNEGVYYDKVLEWYEDNDLTPPRHPNASVSIYVRGSDDGLVPPGAYNRKASNFPCLWGTGGCEHLSRCWGDKVMEKGNQELKERVPDELKGDDDED